ncbi:hypothetical protein [Endozoicomonas sp. Mp262]|uniref:hypothetical protein n=1 Tax=Endozoicomonas sp. Mp262 TaxID=2919499 RepID=UPI0021DB7B6E
MERHKKAGGYILPVAMTVIIILTFTMLGILERVSLEEKKSSNEQQRLRVEQVARTELDNQYLNVEANPDWLRHPVPNKSLSPTLYPNGCSATDKDAICQTPVLYYTGNFNMPADLRAKLPYSNFTGRRFRLSSVAKQGASGASSDMSMELSYVNLELWRRRDYPDALGNNPSREQLSAHLGYFIPPWWEISVKQPWRFGCAAPKFNIGALFGTLFLYGAAGGIGALASWTAVGFDSGLANTILNGNILWVARCRVEYNDPGGARREWESDDINPGDGRVFIVPEGSTNVTFYWKGVLPGRAAGHNGFWDWGRIKWWRIKKYTWSFPDPVDLCTIAFGTSESPKVIPFPFESLSDTAPVNDPENPGAGVRHGRWD